MLIPFRRARIAAALGGAVFLIGAGQAAGAAFALQENSGSGLGNAFAGGAASAEDASTIWSNPAGMSRISGMQVATALHLITPSSKFKNDSSAAAFNQPLGGDGGDAGGLNFVPNLYAVLPINRQIALGLGVNAPFGLKTEYDDGWTGRYQGIKSEIKTINVNPAISYRMSDQVTFGIGADYQKVDATFTSAVNYSGGLAQAAGAAAAGGQIPAAIVPTIIGATGGLDAHANIQADDTAWGWNLGLLFNVDKDTRIGAHYRSPIKYHATGSVGFSYPALPALPPTLAPVVGALAAAVNANLADGGISADIKLPDIANLSIFHSPNKQWDLMADVQYTGWSSIPTLTFVRSSGVVLSSTPENFKNAWRGSVGANYHYNDRVMARAGVAYDQTPVNSTDRTPRLPDNNRVWLSVGGQYKFAPNIALDGGFTYIFVNSPSINQNAGSTTSYGLINGKYDSYVTIVSAQLTIGF